MKKPDYVDKLNAYLRSWGSPGLDTVLSTYPLKEDFIEWLAEDGGRIEYHRCWDVGTGHAFPSINLIQVGVKGTKIELPIKGHLLREIEITIAHELVHIATQGYTERNFKELFEKSIDRETEKYIQNRLFMEKIYRTIPQMVV